METLSNETWDTMDIDEKIQYIADMISEEPDNVDLHKAIIKEMQEGKIAYFAIRKALIYGGCEYLATEDNINEIINEAVKKILTKSIITKYIEKCIEECRDTINIKGYLIGAFKNIARDWVKKKMKDNARVVPAGLYEDDEGNVFENEIADPILIEDEFIIKNERSNQKLLLNSFIQTTLGSDEKPQCLLAIMYMIILAHLTKVQKTVGSLNWALKAMGTKNIIELENNSAARLKNFDCPYIWGQPFRLAINKEYTTKSGEKKLLKDVVYTDEFTKKDMVNWSAPDRTLKRLRIEWLNSLIADGNLELMYELCDVKAAKEALNKLGGVVR